MRYIACTGALLDPNALGRVRATAALVAKVLFRIGWDSAVQVNIGQNAQADIRQKTICAKLRDV